MKKLIFIFILGMFFINFASATADFQHWRHWNGTDLDGDSDIGVSWASIYYYNSSNLITKAINYTHNKMPTVFDTMTQINDSFGGRALFIKTNGLEINITQPLVGTGIEIIWEYAYSPTSKTDWRPLTVTNDSCGIFNNSGVCWVEYNREPAWAVHDNRVHGGAGSYYSGYTIRARIAGFTEITQNMTISPELWWKYKDIRINAGDIYTPAQLYALDVANSWGCMSNPVYGTYTMIGCDLVVNGILNITNGFVLQVGNDFTDDYGDTSIIYPWNNSAIIQLGTLSPLGYGIRGGTLIWANPKQGGDTYFSWGGTFNLYGSTAIINKGGLGHWCEAGKFNWVDSRFEFRDNTILYLTGSSEGNLTRTDISAETIYVYGVNTKLKGAKFVIGSLVGDDIKAFYADSRYTRIDNLDTSVFTNAISIVDYTDLYLVNSNINHSKIALSTDTTWVNGVKNVRTLVLKVTDSEGNEIENATVTVKNKRNITSLYQNIYEETAGTVSLTSTLTPSTVFSVCVSPASCQNTYSAGERYLFFGEVVNITSVTSNLVYFARNQSGTLYKDNSSMSVYYPYRLIENATTDANGNLKWTTDLGEEKDYELVLKYWFAGKTGNQKVIFEEDVHTFKVEKEGYATKEISLNITDLIPEDWTSPVYITLMLEEQPVWNYSNPMAWEGVNNTGIGIIGLDTFGNLKIAGQIHENTNSSYINSIPDDEVAWRIKDLLVLTKSGVLYILGRLFGGIF